MHLPALPARSQTLRFRARHRLGTRRPHLRLQHRAQIHVILAHVTGQREGPLRAGAYTRISADKAGDEHGVANQLADQKRTAAARGYVISRIESDNDISASNGKHRPGYEALMAAAARREIDVILVFQTSRLWRNRRERAEGIEILREAGVSVIATRGPSLDMSTAYGRGMAGLLGEFDTMETEVKGERQRLAAAEAAAAGKRWTACRRPSATRTITSPCARPSGTRSGGPPMRCWADPPSLR